MSEEENKEVENEEVVEAEAAPEAEVVELKPELDPLVAAQEEAAKFKEQQLRAMAEVENTRRRAKKDVEEAHKFSISSFAKEMLDVSDNFARSLSAVPQGEVEKDPALKNLITGIEAVERQMSAAFEKHGIKQVNPMDEQFDPHLHRVMMEQEDSSKPAGTVLQVFQPGYMIHGRLLREAMVVVSKGGAEAHSIDTEA